jgi:hypothetical protein
MRKKKLLLFAAFVAIVCGYAIYDYQAGKSFERQKDLQSFVLPFKEEQIQQVQLTNKNGVTIELKKETDGWKMIKPQSEMADQKAVEEFIQGLVTEKSSDVASEGDALDLSAYGLDQPLAKITVVNNGGETQEFKLGKNKNFQGDAYIQKNDDKKVLVVSSTWFSKADKGPLDFRDKRLMKFPNLEAKKITFEKDKEKFELLKNEGDWVLASNPEWKLDQNKVRELLSMLNLTNALEYISEQEPTPQEMQKWGLSKPRLRVKVDLKDGKIWSAAFAAGTDKVHRVLTSEPRQVMKISPTDSDKFYVMTADSFRDRYEPFQFERGENQEVQIKLGKESYNLKPENDKTQKLLSRLRTLTLAEFRETPGVRFENEISVKSEGKEVFHFQWGNLQKVRINNSETSVFSAQTSKYPKSFTMLESDIKSLQLDELTKNEKIP